MADMMEFPETFDEFVISYGFIDAKKVYTNGSHLIPVFRVKQWLEHKDIHGEWIPKERKTECSVDIDIVCSECGYVGIETYAYGYELNEINMQKVRDYTKELDLNFCPCCGAKMDKAESEE